MLTKTTLFMRMLSSSFVCALHAMPFIYVFLCYLLQQNQHPANVGVRHHHSHEYDHDTDLYV